MGTARRRMRLRSGSKTDSSKQEKLACTTSPSISREKLPAPEPWRWHLATIKALGAGGFFPTVLTQNNNLKLSRPILVLSTSSLYKPYDRQISVIYCTK